MQHIKKMLTLQFPDGVGDTWSKQEVVGGVEDRVLDSMEKAEKERRAPVWTLDICKLK